ncbi:MAG: hypothetical protein HY547_04755 [Elusimicrobia bacterium]|nr:hypothetical protein [Elusimicrobiota bacterium]
MKGKDWRKGLLLALLFIGGGAASGAVAFLAISGEEGKKILKGDFGVFGGNRPLPQSNANSEFYASVDSKELTSSQGAAGQDEDAVPKRLLILIDFKGIPAASVAESSLSLAENGAVKIRDQSTVSVDEGIKSGKIRIAAKSSSRAKRPDPPTISEGGLARAVPEEQSGLKRRSRAAAEGKK